MDKMDRMDRARRVLSGSATSALAALVMVGAIAFGSTVIRPMTANHEPEVTTARADDGAAGTDGGTTAQGGYAHGGDQAGTDGKSGVEVEEDYPEWKPADKPAEEPKEEPADEPKDEPKEGKDEPKPDPAPSGAMTLQANFNADKGKIVVKWTAFGGDFEKYKLVRSSDGHITWPEGEGDTLVGVIGPDSNPYFVDYDAPCNAQVYYAVFAVRHGEQGYVVLGASNVDGALRACSNEPPAEPKAMAFDLMQVEGGVKLVWEQCSSEQFAVYKVVRSATNANPLYPLNDGTELLAAIGDSGTTMFFDSNVEPGQTWTYRILSLGSGGDGWFVLGLTDAKTITVE